MSYFDDASLVFIPSGYKTSKAYSVKPIDGSGDLTFTRSNDTASRVASNGLIERVRTNKLLQSNTFSTTWQFSGTGTVTTGATDPFGGATAWTLAKTAANTFLYQSTAGFSGSHTFSIYAKAGTVDQLWLNHDQSSSFSSYFDLTLGTAIAASGCVATIVSVGGGWYRCSIAGTVATPNNIRIYPASGGSISGTTGNILIYGVQGETGDIATQPILTTSAAVSVGPVANVPRLDYLNSSCPRLLLEPQRTNLVRYSEQFNNAAWGSAGITITANQTVSPDGNTNADLAVSSSSVNYLYQSLGSFSSGTYTASIFAKKGSQSSFAFGFVAGGFTEGMGVKFNFDTQTFSTPINYSSFTSISASYQSYGNGWYRLNLTGTTASATTYYFVLGSLQETFAVNAYVYGAQLEAGAYATSYIPTLGATVTRGADAASKTGISSLIGQTEGTIFLDFVAQVSTTAQSHFWLGSVGNEIGIYGGGSFTFYSSGGVSIAGGSFVTGQRYKIAFAYKANDYVAYVNGVQKGTDTSATVPATSTLYINSYNDFTEIQKKEVNQALLFKTRLTNSELAALTTL